MVGLGTLLFLLSLWWWASWVFRRRMPGSRWFLRLAATSGVLAVVALEAGWTVSEVGRQPWIVWELMKVDQAATANTGVWVTFVGVVVLYAGLGVTTILVLRMMSRRFRRQDEGGGAFDEADVPYGPSRPVDVVEARGTMSTVAAVVLVVAITLYAVFGGADFGAGFWDLVAGGTRRGERPRALIDHSIAPVWEANHVWLIFVFVVLWTCFPQAYASITLTMFVPLTLAALGVVLRGAGFAFRKAVFRTSDRRNFGAAFAIASVLVPYCLGAVIGGVASGRVPAGGVAGDPWSSWVNPTSVVAGLLAVSLCAYLAAFFLVVDARRLSDDAMVEYFRRRATAAAVAAGVVGVVGLFVVSGDAPYVYAGLTSRALPVVLVSVLCGTGALVLLLRHARRGARLAAVVAVGSVIVAWAVAQWDYLLPRRSPSRRARRPPARSPPSSWLPGSRPSCSCRRSGCSTCSTRGRCCPRRAWTTTGCRPLAAASAASPPAPSGPTQHVVGAALTLGGSRPGFSALPWCNGWCMRHRIAATALTTVLVASGVGGCASNEPPQAATSPSSATAIRSPQVLGGAPWPDVPARALPANVTSPMEAEVRSWVERELLPGVRVAVVSPDGVRSVAAGVDGAGTPLKPKDQPPQPNATNEELVPTCNEACGTWTPRTGPLPQRPAPLGGR